MAILFNKSVHGKKGADLDQKGLRREYNQIECPELDTGLDKAAIKGIM